jgi:hypothetical protein
LELSSVQLFFHGSDLASAYGVKQLKLSQLTTGAKFEFTHLSFLPLHATLVILSLGEEIFPHDDALQRYYQHMS